MITLYNNKVIWIKILFRSHFIDILDSVDKVRFFMKKFKNWLNEIYLSICLSEKKTCGW